MNTSCVVLTLFSEERENVYLYTLWTCNLTHIVDFVVTGREVVITYFHQPKENNMYLINL